MIGSGDWRRGRYSYVGDIRSIVRQPWMAVVVATLAAAVSARGASAATAAAAADVNCFTAWRRPASNVAHAVKCIDFETQAAVTVVR